MKNKISKFSQFWYFYQIFDFVTFPEMFPFLYISKFLSYTLSQTTQSQMANTRVNPLEKHLKFGILISKIQTGSFIMSHGII